MLAALSHSAALGIFQTHPDRRSRVECCRMMHVGHCSTSIVACLVAFLVLKVWCEDSLWKDGGEDC